MLQNKKNVILKDYKKLSQLYKAGSIFICLDTETSSTSPSEGRIIEIGAVKFNKDGIISTFSQLINPNQQLNSFITELTHISQDMVDSQKTIEHHLPSFIDFLSTSIIIGHNIGFDMKFLNSECIISGIKPLNNKCVDTHQFSKFLYPTLDKYKLETLADTFNLKKGSSHRAFDDAECCRQLFIKMIEEAAVKYKI